jgi:hypothetical protein
LDEDIRCGAAAGRHLLPFGTVERERAVGGARSHEPLLEALYTDEVDAVCQATETVVGETPGSVFITWLHRFFSFSTSKRLIASELLTDGGNTNPIFGESRARVIAAGRPLLAAAQRAQEVRGDLTLEQILDMIVAIARIPGDPGYLEPILESVLNGICLPTAAKPM